MEGLQLGTVEASERLIHDLYLDLRSKVNAWSRITHQTPQARMGYIGQHLVSVVTGFPGGKSGARGHDLVMGGGEFGEIKTCYRVDQLGACGDCKTVVSSMEATCSACSSTNIQRKDDSKWLISIRNEQELADLLDPKAYYLVLFDFPDMEDPSQIRASIWEVDPKCPGFALGLTDYWLEIRANSESKAPFNLWPFQTKFQLMRPKLIYRSSITDEVATEIFPGRDATSVVALPPLAEYSRATTITQAALVRNGRRYGIDLHAVAKKAQMLTALEAKRSDATPEQFTDALACDVYWPSVSRQLDTLPKKLSAQLKTIVAPFEA